MRNQRAAGEFVAANVQQAFDRLKAELAHAFAASGPAYTLLRPM